MSGEGSGWGGQFWLHNGTILTKLLGVLSVDFPEEQIDEEEVTNLESPNRYKEFIQTLRDGGEFGIELNYTGGSATDLVIRGAMAATAARTWKIVVPAADGTALRQFTGSGFVRKYKPDAMTPGGAMKATFSVRVTGAVTEAVAA